MVKKFNKDVRAIQAFLEKGYSQVWIWKKLWISKSKINYWLKTSNKTVQSRKTKLSNEYIEKKRLSEDKFTSDMGSTKIVLIIDEELKINHFVDKKEKLFKKGINRIPKNFWEKKEN